MLQRQKNEKLNGRIMFAMSHRFRVNGKLNQLKDHLIEFFHLPEVEDDTIWEDDRNKFLKSIEKKK